MKKVTDITLVLATLICLISSGYTEESENINNTTQSATTIPPKVWSRGLKTQGIIINDSYNNFLSTFVNATLLNTCVHG